ncbi:DUF5803 family protein [Salinilacihabitans rarus]|uniref:DUF5803 family protein n=1 Tax=Salinilacihabitans rarus TaxID=2961596 RepID=UPI0020C83C06|nr:DUF5803 family protein [Salinilacihabitans rarus]
MNRRLALATVVAALLVTSAGCAALFDGDIPDEELDSEADYADLRERDADVVVDVESGGLLSSGEFRAVYDLNDTEELSLYRSGFFRDEPLDIRAVRYWHPNGTELTGSQLEIDRSRSATEVRVPDGNGTLAFSGPADGKTFQLPAYVEGSYEVTLPAGYRTSNFLIGDASPGGYEREVVDDRERLAWEHVDSTITLQYYATRDLRLFAGLIAVALTLGGAGIAYYYRQILRLRRRREEMGLDVEIEDDSDRGPPGFG